MLINLLLVFLLHKGFSEISQNIMRLSVNPKQARLVDELLRKGIVKSESVANTLKEVDRGLFTPREDIYSYADSPQSIGCSATISAPHMHAYALEKLKNHLTPGSRVLDVGSGSGYLTLAFSHMMHFTGKVVGVEHIPQLVQNSIANINKACPEAIERGLIEIHVGDGRMGWGGAFKAIHVGAAAEKVPQNLIDQLDNGGRMVIPVGPQGRSQYILIVDKDQHGNVHTRRDIGVSYVPLTDKTKQWRGDL